MTKIGVFDSGIGGKSVANALELAFPDLEIVYVSDPENLPYGTKTPEELKKLVTPKLEELINRGVDIVVIACNTVSTTILDYVKDLVKVPVIGVEPLIEEAVAISNNKIITVCATPTTLNSQKYKDLKNKYARGVEVIEPDCSRWTKMIEDNQLDREEIYKKINSACEEGADVVVLGCTHYHWIEDLITEVANNRAKVINPENLVIEKVKQALVNS